jgi:glycosyltransferase involved in cell wall biosynthesis
MRILHIGKYYAPQRGGIERHTQDLAEHFVADGHTVGVLVHQPPGRWRTQRQSLNGVEITRAGCPAAPLYAPLSPTFPLHLSRMMEDVAPDVLHLHMPNPSCFAALFSRRARRIPWIVHWHADISPEMPDWRVHAAYRVYRPFEQAVLRHAHAVIATSREYLEASAALAPWRGKARVVPLGIDGVSRSLAEAPSWPNDSSLRLLAVGRLSHYKGFDILLKAIAQTAEVSLLLIGNGEEAQRLRELAAQLGIVDRVSFVSHLDDNALSATYDAADLFVLPSLDRSEAFGIVLLEAMRAGLPVIASAIQGSGVLHVVEHEKTGLLIPPGDADLLAEAIRQLSADPERRRQLGAAGRVRWRQAFTLERSAQDVSALYREATNACLR